MSLSSDDEYGYHYLGWLAGWQYVFVEKNGRATPQLIIMDASQLSMTRLMISDMSRRHNTVALKENVVCFSMARQYHFLLMQYIMHMAIFASYIFRYGRFTLICAIFASRGES